MPTRTLKSIAVFCGSNFGGSEHYSEGAAQFGNALAAADITLIYGGTTKGLMGIVADAVLEAGGKAHGVITESLHQRGHSHIGLTSHEIALTLRARKERMIALADAFVAMPGGIGTLEEMMEVWTMNQLGEMDKPVGLLSLEGFYSPFLGFIDHMIDQKFLPPSHRESIAVEGHPTRLIDKLKRYKRVDVPKWL